MKTDTSAAAALAELNPAQLAAPRFTTETFKALAAAVKFTVQPAILKRYKALCDENTKLVNYRASLAAERTSAHLASEIQAEAESLREQFSGDGDGATTNASPRTRAQLLEQYSAKKRASNEALRRNVKDAAELARPVVADLHEQAQLHVEILAQHERDVANRYSVAFCESATIGNLRVALTHLRAVVPEADACWLQAPKNFLPFLP